MHRYISYPKMSAPKFKHFPRKLYKNKLKVFKRNILNFHVYKPLARLDSMRNVSGALLVRYVDPNSGERYNIRHKLKLHDLQMPILVLFIEQGYDQSLTHGMTFF